MGGRRSWLPVYGVLMAVTVRQWTPGDEPFLWEMLYQAIHVPAGHAPPPRSVLSDPPIHHYLAEFGSRPGDDAVVSCDDGLPVGAAFCRVFGADDPSYGFVSNDVPEVSMAVVPGYRGQGIGRAMLTALLDRYPTMSLSVDADNVVARALYESLGFAMVRRDGTSLTMLRRHEQ
jgi:ribosomal protein S18 acetylase RimI-like enzyme